ncbi:unnamed protein product, partial [Nesidiocoris tenuis]
MPRRGFASVPRPAFASVPRPAFASVPRPTFASVPVWSDKGKRSSCQVLISCYSQLVLTAFSNVLTAYSIHVTACPLGFVSMPRSGLYPCLGRASHPCLGGPLHPYLGRPSHHEPRLYSAGGLFHVRNPPGEDQGVPSIIYPIPCQPIALELNFSLGELKTRIRLSEKRLDN